MSRFISSLRPPAPLAAPLLPVQCAAHHDGDASAESVLGLALELEERRRTADDSPGETPPPSGRRSPEAWSERRSDDGVRVIAAGGSRRAVNASAAFAGAAGGGDGGADERSAAAASSSCEGAAARERVPLLDNAKAALIYLVVVYHTLVVYTSADRPEGIAPPARVVGGTCACACACACPRHVREHARVARVGIIPVWSAVLALLKPVVMPSFCLISGHLSCATLSARCAAVALALNPSPSPSSPHPHSTLNPHTPTR